MGLRDHVKRVQEAATAKVQESERLTKLAEAGREVGNAAIEEAKLKNKQGEITKTRMSRAVVRPTKTGRKLLKGAASEAVRHGRDYRQSQHSNSSPPEYGAVDWTGRDPEDKHSPGQPGQL